MLPDVNTTKYCVLADRLLVGSIVSVESDRVRRLLVAALKLSTMVPVAEPERRVMVPVPRTMASEKVTTMLALKVTPVAASTGVKAEMVGAISSTSDKVTAMACVSVNVPSETWATTS